MKVTALFQPRVFQRAWFYATLGHSRYYNWIYALTTFSLIFYNFFVKEISLLQTLFPTVFHFLMPFLLIYAPLIVLTGYAHRKRQIGIETGVQVLENPFLFQATPGKERLQLWLMYYNNEMRLKIYDGLAKKIGVDISEEKDIILDLNEKIRQLAEGERMK